MALEAKECEVCLLDSSLSDIGEYQGRTLCKECREFETNPIDWDRLRTGWFDYVASLKATRVGKYDCLFALSGGKDSISALHATVTKYGLRPLVFTVDHGYKPEATIENCRRATNRFGLDWLLLKAGSGVVSRIRDSVAIEADIPCFHCAKTWKNEMFKSVADLTGIRAIFTGGDTPTNGSAVLPGRPEWGVTSIGTPLAVEGLTEAQVYEVAYSLGWENPGITGWDTDCTAVGPGLLRFREKQGRYHPEEVRHLSHRVRHGMLEKEAARAALAAFEVKPEYVGQFG